MRANRPAHRDLPSAQRVRANARAYARIYQSRGKLIAQPCEGCGAKAEKHHDDYAKPLQVRWLCRRCHLAEHRAASNDVSMSKAA